MYDADAIEAINFEQLATLTDRMLLRGRAAKQWPKLPSLAKSTGARMLARGTQPRIDVRSVRQRIADARLAPAPAPKRSANGFELSNNERTVCVRSKPATRTEVVTMTLVIPTLVGIATGLAALLVF